MDVLEVWRSQLAARAFRVGGRALTETPAWWGQYLARDHDPGICTVLAGEEHPDSEVRAFNDVLATLRLRSSWLLQDVLCM